MLCRFFLKPFASYCLKVITNKRLKMLQKKMPLLQPAMGKKGAEMNCVFTLIIFLQVADSIRDDQKYLIKFCFPLLEAFAF